MSVHNRPDRNAFIAGLFQHPLMLMLITGSLLGFKFPLGKVAGNAGVSPVMWALIVSVGAAAFLFPLLLARRTLVLPKGRLGRYIVISGLVSFVTPNLLVYSVMPHTGAGYTGLMFALSPLFTMSLAALFRLEKPGGLRLIGILVGLLGAGTVSLTRGLAADAPALAWMMAALLIPVALACGNIYRTLDWPEGTSPDVLAFWSHGFAVLVYLVLLLIRGDGIAWREWTLAPVTAVVQIVLAGATFPVFFRLQKRGGPVLLSHVGYVAAGVGLLAGTFVLGEHYGLWTWVGAGVIALGMVFTFLANVDRTRRVGGWIKFGSGREAAPNASFAEG